MKVPIAFRNLLVGHAVVTGPQARPARWLPTASTPQEPNRRGGNRAETFEN